MLLTLFKNQGYKYVIRYILFIFFVAHNLVFAQQKQSVIAFASDTQEPLLVEKFLHKHKHNLEATRMIFKDISSLHPDALFILGDVVSLGKSATAWTHIDRYIKQAKKDSIPIYATLGNHEVMFNKKKGVRNFSTRFPSYNPAGYTVVIDSVAVLLLNSNFTAMTPAEINEQNNWHQKKLKALDEDDAIKLVIVGCHHSPFTNSRTVQPSKGVQKNFVPPFIASKKCVLFLSGHSHNYEQFKVQGKSFVVIGGGGGLHQPLNANNEVMYDLAGSYKPEFHYLEVRRQQDVLEVISRQLKPDFSGFMNTFSFKINSLSL